MTRCDCEESAQSNVGTGSSAKLWLSRSYTCHIACCVHWLCWLIEEASEFIRQGVLAAVTNSHEAHSLPGASPLTVLAVVTWQLFLELAVGKFGSARAY